MTKRLKYMYNPRYFEAVCPVLKECIPNFDCQSFIFLVFDNQWPDLELKQRIRHIAKALHYFLPAEFPVAVERLIAVAQELHYRGYPHGFENIFLQEYIKIYGLGHPEESLQALEQINRLINSTSPLLHMREN